MGHMEQAGVFEPEEGTPPGPGTTCASTSWCKGDFDLREATITGTIVNDNPASAPAHPAC